MRIDVGLEGLCLGSSGSRARSIRIRPPSELRDPVADYNPLAGAEFQALLQSFYDGTMIADLNGVILDMNRRLTRLVGLSRESLLGELAISLLLGADQELLATIRSTVEDDQHVLLQAYVAREGEDDFPAEVAVNRLTVGRRDYLCFFIRDISVRKQVQQRLRIEHSAVQNAGAGIVITALDGGIRYVNPAFVRLWGSEDGECVRGEDVRRVFADEEEAERIVDLVLGGSTWDSEVRARRCDGKVFYVAVSATANEDEDGHIVGLVFSFMDIDARRRAEEALRRYQTELEAIVNDRTEGLREANLRLEMEVAERAAAQEEIQNTTHYHETIIRTSQDGILVANAAGRFEFLNEAADRILGRSHDALMNMPFVEVVAPDLQTFIHERWAEVQRGEGASYEVDIVTEDGTRRSVMVSHGDMKIGGEPKYCVVIRDITSRRTMEDELRSAIRRLEEHNLEKTAFVSNVSHELRTPLTSLAYATDNLLSGVLGEVSGQVREYLNMMQQDCWRLTGTIQDILDLSRLESNRLRLRRRKVPLGWMVRRCGEALKLQCEKKNQTLDIRVPSASGFAHCDQRRIERALGNVLQNAMKFTPEGGRVELSVRPGVDHVEISVKDGGIGIPADHLPRVMDRYYRVGERVSGTGLGLALCKEIVELHGGTVSIMSPPPGETRGTCVILRLPIEEAPCIAVLAREGEVRDRFTAVLEGVRYSVLQWNPDVTAVDPSAAEKVDVVVLDLSTCLNESLALLAQALEKEKREPVAIVAVGSSEKAAIPVELLEAMHVPLLAEGGSDDLILAIENVIFDSDHQHQK